MTFKEYIAGKTMAIWIPIATLFWRGTTKRSLARRHIKPKHKGCTSCMACCIKCPNLDKETGRCMIWDNADYLCRAFPIFKIQLEKMGLKDKCKYFWEDE
jgi:hypothetical protein